MCPEVKYGLITAVEYIIMGVFCKIQCQKQYLSEKFRYDQF